MNISAKQKQSHRYREQICGCQGVVGVGRIGSLGLAEATIIYSMDKQCPIV